MLCRHCSCRFATIYTHLPEFLVACASHCDPDGVQGTDALFSKARLTWRPPDGAATLERYISASCGSYTVLWNFRHVKVTTPTVISNEAYTLTDGYMLISKASRVVETGFRLDRQAPAGSPRRALVVATEDAVYNGDERRSR